MKLRPFFSIVLLLSTWNMIAQGSSEVFLFDMETEKDTVRLLNKRNISNNEGYDNQPSFYNDNTVLFASNRGGQTDIVAYRINSNKISWISSTPRGSEYSPLKIPDENAISAIRLDTNGLQRLYRYDFESGKSKEIIKDLKVGYHLWYDQHIIVSTVLVENRMDLVVSNLKDGTKFTFQKNVGRSLHKIPNSHLISFISKEGATGIVKSMNPVSGATKEIIELVDKSEDIAWLNDGTLVTGYDNMLLGLKPGMDNEWELLSRFDASEIRGISRLAISANGRHLALVAKDSPFKIVEKQVTTFNARDLDAFVGCYAERVTVLNYPADTLYTGRGLMKKNYRKFYKNNPFVEVKVASRIAIGNFVIDQELVTIGNDTNQQVALYEIDDLINSMSFIQDREMEYDPELIVQKQLDAYNSRDLEGFLSTYSDSIKIYNYPGQLSSSGLPEIRKDYAAFFQTTPDLHCEIKNRIVIGNKIIDHEYITMNGEKLNAVAIYEVWEGKIDKVTFIR